MSLLEEWALSKEGVGALIVFSVILAFGIGYNWNRVEGAFTKVKDNRKLIRQNSKEINQNETQITTQRRRLDNAKDRRQELNRTLRIIACNSNDLANNPTAQNMLNCSDFE
jgi:hypothetical protein